MWRPETQIEEDLCSHHGVSDDLAVNAHSACAGQGSVWDYPKPARRDRGGFTVLTTMTGPPASRRTRARDIFGLVVFLTICLGTSGIGGAVTATSVGSWYQDLQKPSFNPPDRVFPPVWTALYVMIAVAGWRVWRAAGLRTARTAFLLYAVQLALNLTWSFLFFGSRLIGVALIEVVVLLLAIVANTILFWRHDRLAGMLLVPYGIWVAFATMLNAAIWRLN